MLENDWIILLSAAALAFSVLNYVLLDGTDLGVGVLLGLTRCSQHRRAMAVTILPIWDANETWLVLGGGGCWPCFRWLTPPCCRRFICRLSRCFWR